MATPTPPDSSALPLRPALRADNEDVLSPRTAPQKVVSIAESEEEIPPLTLPEETTKIKQFPASTAGRRLSGRPVMSSNSSSRLSLVSQGSMDDPAMSSDTSNVNVEGAKHHHHHRHSSHSHDKLLTQVAEWLQAEKAKRAARKAKKRDQDPAVLNNEWDGSITSRPRASSQSSDSSAISLERLQKILEDNMGSFGSEILTPLAPSPGLGPRRPSSGARRRSSIRKLGGGQSSDTEYQDGDVVVPSCDVVLDNSKTMSYTGGAAPESSDTTATLSTSKRADKERRAWLIFKNEIVRLAHTLRLKGWRRVPLEKGGDIEVERLSGALTNAVYVVSPPKDLPPLQTSSTTSKPHTPKPPPKLLLRIYGPQVEHLIDRENELGILRRLARKKIGPRLLGTFQNGRFEEFFHAQTLTNADLRVADTSKQIAKRMRELHEGIDLLEREREEGPFVWLNWDKWVDRCEEVISYLDKEILSGNKGKGESWRERGLVCGVEWPLFKATIDKYRKWLDDVYGKGGVRRKLVFAHNDTQYGNILRLIPEKPTDGSAPSPLLLPQNTHKQLVVIDFEYASANTPGLEFANHFTEWCYNYHDAAKPWACNTNWYPTLEEQTRFIKSYINHRPQFNPRASATPKMTAMDGMAKGSISEFLLDSRTPSGTNLADQNYAEEEARREKETDRQVNELLKEVRIWRVANSAQWVAWGIVQAQVPDLDEPKAASPTGKENTPPNTLENAKADEVAEKKDDTAEHHDAEEEEFDYLAYAQDRAMFFWGDVVQLGIVKADELPESLRKSLRIVEY